MFAAPLFRRWFIAALLVWIFLFLQVTNIDFLLEHWYYPAIMVLGAFVAGSDSRGRRSRGFSHSEYFSAN